MCVIRHEQNSNSKERQDQAQCGVYGVVARDHADGPHEDHRRSTDKNKKLHLVRAPCCWLLVKIFYVIVGYCL